MVVIPSAIITACKPQISKLDVAPPADAMDIRTIFQTRDSIGINFNFKPIHDSLELLRYYDNKLREMGWIPFVEDYYSAHVRIWVSFNGESWLTAYWVNKERTRRVSIIIKQRNVSAFGPQGRPNLVEQRVEFEEKPFYEIPYDSRFYLMQCDGGT